LSVNWIRQKSRVSRGGREEYDQGADIFSKGYKSYQR